MLITVSNYITFLPHFIKHLGFNTILGLHEEVTMRTVVFVKRQELELSGSLSPNALVLGDVDNDSVS